MPLERKSYHIAVVIGRFQICHVGHELLIQHALTIADKVIIVIGSSHHARTPRNPFTWEERADMIKATLKEQQRNKVIYIPVRDYFNDQRWTAAVKQGVNEHAPPKNSSALVGHKKEGDTSNYYLDHFPDWRLVGIESPYKVDAAMLRKLYFEATAIDMNLTNLTHWVSQPVRQFLKSWSSTPDYNEVICQRNALVLEKQEWLNSPYVMTYTSVHALVESKGQLLLGRKKTHPGKGLWTLPGGFIKPHEKLVQAVLRQLLETTQTSIPETALLNYLTIVKVFDHPNRSDQGRIITHVHWFQIPNNQLPKTKATDPFSEIKWFPIEIITQMEDQLFEDHFHILDSFYNLLDANHR